MQVIFLLSQTSSCAALRAADLGLSGQDAFAQWHSFDQKNVTWQTRGPTEEKVIIVRYPRGVTTNLLDV